MAVNRGKDFENCIREGFERVVESTIDRLPDQMNGFAGGSNICDFIAYKYPTMLYLECKSCYGNTLNFHNITDKQWEGLYAKSKIPGIKAGVMVWFIDHDVTFYVPINYLYELKEEGVKSLNIKYMDFDRVIKIEGYKKRIFFVYNMNSFWEELRNE